MAKKTKIVRLDFYDHSRGNGENLGLIPCSLIGILIGENEKSYFVCSWIAGSEIDSNADCYSVHKKTLIKFTELCEFKPLDKSHFRF